ncbi:MAG: hypothetical protein DCF25_14875 [Leptolyngbya foveolarum]|uniref:Uncharacterized protein n=1 Tax=Leptolyngbya foveolarum TaxID=47253 RepID=A0A2W4U5K7_9CYAN|nr:MAG: hypothetical protein DCF25_14875 [Leptolyngbya foveolarum]
MSRQRTFHLRLAILRECGGERYLFLCACVYALIFVLYSYSCALMKAEEDCWGTSAWAALKLETAYRGRVSVTVAIAKPIRLAIWPGGGSDGCSGLAGSMREEVKTKWVELKRFVVDLRLDLCTKKNFDDTA